MNKAFLIVIVIIAGILRLWNLGSLPPNLTGDELSLGYNATTILQNGVDEHGEKYPLWFEAYGEYKMPVYIYSTVVSLQMFGINDTAIRLPAALFGTLSVVFLYFIVKNLLDLTKKKYKHTESLALLSAFIFAILPWHIQLSRTALESIVALGLFEFGCLLIIYFWEKKNQLYLLSGVIVLTGSVYTYNSYRILTPLVLLIIGFLIFNFKKLKRKPLVLYAVISALMLLPAFLFSISPEGLARFSEASAFNNAPSNQILLILSYPLTFFRNFLSYFSFSYLFTGNSENFENITYYVSPDFGLLYHWTIPFFVIGIYTVIRNFKSNFYKILIFSLLIIPIPAALTISPHPLRALPLAPVLSVIVAIGILQLFYMKSIIARLFLAAICFFAIFEIVFFSHTYMYHYPNLREALWGTPTRVIEQLEIQQKNYSMIVVNKNVLAEGNLTGKLYSPNLDLMYVDDKWEKPSEWNDKKVLYVYDGKKPKPWLKKHIQNVHLNTGNHDKVAEFWEI